ncbi:MAG: hypothetical protein K8U03_00980 [Planctomycetia bacterium]|nr:hypothetical protein [Planctomycetia bacterium]
MKKLLKAALLAALCFCYAPQAAQAEVAAKAVRETVEYVTKKFSKEAGEEGLEVLAKKIEVFATKHGDEGIEAMRKLGPRALRIADEAGPNSAAAIRAMARFGDDGVVWIAKRPAGLELASKYGDDAAEVLVKHKELAEPLLKESGEAAVRALKAVDPQNGRLLAMMSTDQATAPLARNAELLDVVGRYGDNAMQFIWRNKGKLAVTAGLAAFLADPKPFIDGTRDLSQAALQPLAEIPGAIARSMDWTLVAIVMIVVGCIVGGGVVAWKMYLRYRHDMRLKFVLEQHKKSLAQPLPTQPSTTQSLPAPPQPPPLP